MVAGECDDRRVGSRDIGIICVHMALEVVGQDVFQTLHGLDELVLNVFAWSYFLRLGVIDIRDNRNIRAERVHEGAELGLCARIFNIKMYSECVACASQPGPRFGPRPRGCEIGL